MLQLDQSPGAPPRARVDGLTVRPRGHALPMRFSYRCRPAPGMEPVMGGRRYFLDHLRLSHTFYRRAAVR